MTVIINGTTGVTSVNGSAAAPSVTGTDTDTGIVYGTNTLSLATGGTAAMTITSGQQIGFGTSTPASSVAVAKVVAVENASSAGFKATSTGGASIEMYAAPSATYIDTVTNNPMVFYINSTERGRWNAGSPVLCLSGGNTSAGGTGIAFPATQSASSDANTLDDYEEGTWVPVLSFGNQDHDGTYSYQSASYVKVGQIVYVQGIVGLSSAGTRTGTAAFKGLPFTAYSQSGGAGGTPFGLYNGMSGINYSIQLDGPNNAASAPMYTETTTGYSVLSKSNFGSTCFLQFAFSYRAAA
jgi:hypothetical protein